MNKNISLVRAGIDCRSLLRGYYEAERLPKDFSPERIVPDFAFNVLNPLGLLYRPVVDEDYLQNGGQKPTWPDGKPFAVCLTHDVDAVSLYSLNQSLKKRRVNLFNTHSTLQWIKNFLGFGIDIIQNAQNALRQDPYHCYERWLEAEKEVGAHSTFFFWPGWSNVSNHHNVDCGYELFDRVIFDAQKCTVTEMMQEIKYRGCEIGLHPSWYSFDDADELKKQKEALEYALGHEVISVRQHCLHYDIRSTPRVHAKVGFKYDSTLGFNDNVGFRFGTCYPWFVYDLKAEKGLPIMEIPLIIQDGAMLNSAKGMRLDQKTAFQYVIHLSQTVEKVGGVLTLLWHPHMIVKQDWWDLYIRVLKYLKSRNAWLASVREVGEWWRNLTDVSP